MPYRLIRFGDVALPLAMPTDDLSTGEASSGLREGINGVYTYTPRTLPRRHQFQHRGLYTGAITYRVTDDGSFRVTDDGSYRVTVESALDDLAQQTDDLKGLEGQWGTLWRERLPGGELSWKECKLLQVQHVETVENADVVSEVESTFETKMAAWRDEVATTTSVSAVNGVPKAMLVDNNGPVPVLDAVLRVQRTSGTITAVALDGNGIDLIWTGSIGSGQTLVIDGSDKTVTIGTTDEYGGFGLDTEHTDIDWLPLQPGSNLLSVTVVGGNATVSIEHYRQQP